MVGVANALAFVPMSPVLPATIDSEPSPFAASRVGAEERCVAGLVCLLYSGIVGTMWWNGFSPADMMREFCRDSVALLQGGLKAWVQSGFAEFPWNEAMLVQFSALVVCNFVFILHSFLRASGWQGLGRGSSGWWWTYGHIVLSWALIGRTVWLFWSVGYFKLASPQILILWLYAALLVAAVYVHYRRGFAPRGKAAASPDA